MDVKEQINQIVEKISKDGALQERFKTEPIKAVEQILGVDLPDEIIEKVIAGVKAKISVDQVSGAVDALKKLF
ncbi:MAG: hypothetical protein HFF18_00740 [Oscillospiraceae bacterium]|nr:hypothetical protein [Oscillospiraceae bacterium]